MSRARDLAEFDRVAASMLASQRALWSAISAFLDFARFVYGFARYIERVRRPPLCLPAPAGDT